MNQALLDRLMSRVTKNENGCWIYNASYTRGGYGRIRNKNERPYAHRVSYELHVGPIPDDLLVLHKCDVPSCINPNHLFVGTQIDNMADMRSKNRQPPRAGEAGAHKLTKEQVLKIRDDDRWQWVIGLSYGITQNMVSKIKLRQVWSNI